MSGLPSVSIAKAWREREGAATKFCVTRENHFFMREAHSFGVEFFRKAALIVVASALLRSAGC